MTNLSFLKNEIDDSLKSLLEKMTEKMKSAASRLEGTVVTMLVAAFTVLKGLGMDEEIRLLGLLVVSRFGEKGLTIPEEVSSLILPPTSFKPQPVAPIKVAPVATASPAIKLATAQKMPIQPEKKVSATAPARTLKNNGGGVFATALGKAANGLGLGPLATFRKLIVGDGRGHNWNALREAVTAVLGQKLLEPADWKSLVEVLKTSIFFTDEDNVAAFIAQCPREQMTDLLFGGEKNLKTLLQSIREEDKSNGFSPLYVNFIIEVCVLVGKDAKDILIGAKQAVNRMKQKGFIKVDHWLARKVSRMNTRTTPLPVAKFASPEVIQKEKQEALVATQPVVNTATVAEPKPQQGVIATSDKPFTEDLDSDFARTMLSGEQQAPPVPTPEHEGSDVTTTSKPIFTMSLGTAEPVVEGQKVNGKLIETPIAEVAAVQ